MAVPAIELKPRGPIALVDSAIRLCARSSGVWALALPGGALITWAALHLVESIQRGHELLIPAALFTVAWIARGLFQGAACHYLDEQVLGTTAPNTWRSLKAALGRFPSLAITAAYLPAFNLLSLTFTVGLAMFFLSSHLVGWAVTMKGKGHPLALYGTCARLLGPARSNASNVRWLFGVIFLVALNVHIGANALVYVARKLIGLDLTYAQRFVSLDNATWVTVACALTFTLFEPLRAAAATLLLIDGRVRQEGLDLIASVEQLPKRRAKSKPLIAPGAGGAAAAVLLALGLSFGLLAPSRAHAQDEESYAEDEETLEALQPAEGEESWPDGDESFGGAVGGLVGEEAPAQTPIAEFVPRADMSLLQRLQAVSAACGYQSHVVDHELQGVERLGPAEQAAFKRLVDDLELFAWTWQDCQTVTQRLDQSVPLLASTVQQVEGAPQEAKAAAEKAQSILARAEFVPPAERVKQETPEEPPDEEDPNSWWARFKKKLREWLKDLLRDEVEIAPPPALGGGGIAAANMVAVLLVAAVIVLIGVLVFLAFRGKSDERTEYEVETAAVNAAGVDPYSALARPPEGWSSLADELAASGNFREAVRSLYLALLSRLHRVGAIDYDPTLSNWDYCRQFRGHREWVPTFRELTSRFDFAWYGKFEVGQDGYASFRKLTEPILSAPTPDAPPRQPHA